MSTGTLRLKKLEHTNGTDALTINTDGSLSAGTLAASGTLAVTGNTTVGGTLVNTGLITASGGVAIGGTDAAHTLDDYEEGTFSPTLKNEGDTNLSTTKTANNIASYVKIGSMVYFHMIISINAVSGGSSQNLIVDDMPFACKSISTHGYGGATVTYTAWNSTDPIAAVMLSASDNLRLYTGALQPASSNQLSTSTYIVLHGHYPTAS